MSQSGITGMQLGNDSAKNCLSGTESDLIIPSLFRIVRDEDAQSVNCTIYSGKGVCHFVGQRKMASTEREKLTQMFSHRDLLSFC